MCRLDLEINLNYRLFVQLERFTYLFRVTVIRCQFDFAMRYNDVFKASLKLLSKLSFKFPHCHNRVRADLKYFKCHGTIDRQEPLVKLSTHPMCARGWPNASLHRVYYLCLESGGG